MKTTPNSRSVRTLIPFAGYLSPLLSCFSPRQPARFSRVVLEYSTAGGGFDMKKTLDSFMDSVSQKQLTEAQSKALSDRLALEKEIWRSISSIMWSFWFHLPWFRAPDVTRNIQHDIARRMKGEQ